MDFTCTCGVSMSTILHINGKPVTLENVERASGAIRFQLNGQVYHFRAERTPGGGFVLEEEISSAWRRTPGYVTPGAKGAKRVQLGCLEASISETPSGAAHGHGAATLSPLAPMPGVVRQILVAVSDKVTRGQPIAILEAMKLQFTLSAGGDAVVEAVLVQPGQLVPEGAELVKLKAVK